MQRVEELEREIEKLRGGKRRTAPCSKGLPKSKPKKLLFADLDQAKRLILGTYEI